MKETVMKETVMKETVMNPDRLAELEEERAFLLTSIRDIEKEYAVGDVDDDDYRTLRDGYVARAAAVLREIDDGKAALPPKQQRPLWRRIAVPMATLGVAVVLGVAVSQYAGQRLPGQTLTGGQPADKVSQLLAQGRSLLSSDPTGAVAAYQRVLELEPDNVEARTYSGWLVVLNGQQADDDEQIRQGIELLKEAAALDATYADPHCLLAVANGRFLATPDVETAKEQGQLCLDANPPRDMVPMIQGLLDSL
jgi:hypothetical protein